MKNKSNKPNKPNKSNKKVKKTILNHFIEHIYTLNNSKFFAGFIMLIMNVGSKYVTVELSKSQEDYIKYTLGRQLLVFAILWMGTKDIVVALVLTCIFILFADYLFNDTSKFCIIPNRCMVNENDKITKKEINDAILLLKKARQKKNGQKSNPDDSIINKGLYKENFI